MTSYIRNRCIHCGTQYNYQASGPSSQRYNDPDYCTECKIVLCRALLKERLRYYTKRSRNIKNTIQFKEITLDQILQWEIVDNHRRQELRASGKLVGQRIGVGLVNISTGEWQNVREVCGHDKFEGYRFMVSTWPSKSDDYEITISMEYDLIKQEFTDEIWY